MLAASYFATNYRISLDDGDMRIERRPEKSIGGSPDPYLAEKDQTLAGLADELIFYLQKQFFEYDVASDELSIWYRILVNWNDYSPANRDILVAVTELMEEFYREISAHINAQFEENATYAACVTDDLKIDNSNHVVDYGASVPEVLADGAIAETVEPINTVGGSADDVLNLAQFSARDEGVTLDSVVELCNVVCPPMTAYPYDSSVLGCHPHRTWDLAEANDMVNLVVDTMWKSSAAFTDAYVVSDRVCRQFAAIVAFERRKFRLDSSCKTMIRYLHHSSYDRGSFGRGVTEIMRDAHGDTWADCRRLFLLSDETGRTSSGLLAYILRYLDGLHRASAVSIFLGPPMESDDLAKLIDYLDKGEFGLEIHVHIQNGTMLCSYAIGDLPLKKKDVETWKSWILNSLSVLKKRLITEIRFGPHWIDGGVGPNAKFEGIDDNFLLVRVYYRDKSELHRERLLYDPAVPFREVDRNLSRVLKPSTPSIWCKYFVGRGFKRRQYSYVVKK
jgi:hypothetical protein